MQPKPQTELSAMKVGAVSYQVPSTYAARSWELMSHACCFGCSTLPAQIHHHHHTLLHTAHNYHLSIKFRPFPIVPTWTCLWEWSWVSSYSRTCFRNLSPLNTSALSCHFWPCSPVVLGLVAKPHSGFWSGSHCEPATLALPHTHLWVTHPQLFKGRLFTGEKCLWRWETLCSQLPYGWFFRAE